MTRARFLCGLLAVGLATCGAQPGAGMAAEPVAPAATRIPAAPIGRFFFSATERAQLDIARVQKKPAAIAQEAVEAPSVPETVTYGGLVRRSDGRQMLWLNNRLVDAKEGLAGMSIRGKVRPDGAVTLQAPSGATVDLKVGQSVELYTGKVAEVRKPSPEDLTKVQPGEAKPTESRDAAADAKSPAVAAQPPAPEGGERKPAPAAPSVKLDLGGK